MPGTTAAVIPPPLSRSVPSSRLVPLGDFRSNFVLVFTVIHHFASFVFFRLVRIAVLQLIGDLTMLRRNVGQGLCTKSPRPKRGGRTATRRSNGSGERVRAHDKDELMLLDALGLSPWRLDATASIAMMGTAGDNEDWHWLTEFGPEEHRRPGITEPFMLLYTGHEGADVGAARPQVEGLRFSPIRDTARARAGSVPPGFPSRSALSALEVVNLMENRHRARDTEERLYARLPRLAGPTV